MGLFTYTLAGGGFLIVGACEAILSTSQTLEITTPSTKPSSSANRSKPDPFFSSLNFFAIFLLSFFFILNSLISLFDAVNSRDQTGVVLQLEGMWFVQMGFSFYSNLIVHGCSLNEKSRGNFTIRCKGHPEYHRGRAIATLQFNCHLALLVTLIAGVYSVFCKMNGIKGRSEMQYRPLGAHMVQLDNQAQFTLDSDDDVDDNEHGGVKEEGNIEMQKALAIVPDSGINGYGSNH